ncbi:MAG: hypothetical protein ACREVA_10140, partial [Burkholderiales bacterium]
RPRTRHACLVRPCFLELDNDCGQRGFIVPWQQNVLCWESKLLANEGNNYQGPSRRQRKARPHADDQGE